MRLRQSEVPQGSRPHTQTLIARPWHALEGCPLSSTPPPTHTGTNPDKRAGLRQGTRAGPAGDGGVSGGAPGVAHSVHQTRRRRCCRHGRRRQVRMPWPFVFQGLGGGSLRCRDGRTWTVRAFTPFTHSRHTLNHKFSTLNLALQMLATVSCSGAGFWC